MAVNIITGRAGSGKTTIAVKILHDHLRVHGDYTIITNTPLIAEKFKARVKVGFMKYKTVVPTVIYVKTKEEWYKELIERTKCVHLIDEAGVWCNAYNFKKIPDIVYEKLNQVRHNEVHIIGTTKKFKHVYTRLRENTDAVIEISRFPKTKVSKLEEPKKPLIIQYDYYDTDMYELQNGHAEEEIKKKYRLERKWLFNMENVMRSFDTKYNIEYGKE